MASITTTSVPMLKRNRNEGDNTNPSNYIGSTNDGSTSNNTNYNNNNNNNNTNTNNTNNNNNTNINTNNTSNTNNNNNWEKEFYKNGYPKEVIVIEDSPTPPPNHQPEHQSPYQQHYPYTNPDPSSTGASNQYRSAGQRLNKVDLPSSSGLGNHSQPLGLGVSNLSYSSLPKPPSMYPSGVSLAMHNQSSYATAPTAAAATAAFQASNKRAREQHQEDMLSSMNKRRKDVSYLRLDPGKQMRSDWGVWGERPLTPSCLPIVSAKAGQYSTLPTNTTSTSNAPTTAPTNTSTLPLAQMNPPLPESYDDKDGHYIIKLNESLTARYKIMRLLGQGTFGKVVECYDRVRRTFCAVKVIRAIPKYRDASKIEIRVLNTLKEHDPLNLNKCIHLLEWFDYRNHICMVFELLGQSVFDFLKSNHFKPFPSTHIQQFAKQLLTSVAFLHDLKLIHTDLKPENILLVNPTSHYGAGGNKQSLILENTDIRLIDFGSATFERDYHSSVVSTRHYRAPEIILGMGWSYPCDVWSIGCILVEFFTGDALFHTHDNLEHLAMMEAVIGTIPSHLIRLTSREGQKLFKDHKLRYPDTKTTHQSRQYVRNMKPINQLITPTTPLNAEFMDLIRKMLVYDPATRITARDALRHPFFNV